ncbi:Root UVB sensitive family [Dillenia turbinata]|uniref:Root UVB sensitive family n=1 Tax=Dillenia turbinata TaxID=194707 RepID=A0AAN8W364_9MAGN
MNAPRVFFLAHSEVRHDCGRERVVTNKARTKPEPEEAKGSHEKARGPSLSPSQPKKSCPARVPKKATPFIAADTPGGKRFASYSLLKVNVLDDSRSVVNRMVDSFLSQFFPSGYPYSVSEGYLIYNFGHYSTLAVQHYWGYQYSVTEMALVLKNGMQHVGKLICSNMGARMDSEPKPDVLYDLGTGLEVLSSLCPHLFLEIAGLGNFARGVAVVAARATSLPIYSSFAKEGNLSDLFTKGEAISTLFNVAGIRSGILLLEKYQVLLIYCTKNISLFPGRLIADAGSVKVGRPLHKIFRPSEL